MIHAIIEIGSLIGSVTLLWIAFDWKVAIGAFLLALYVK